MLSKWSQKEDQNLARIIRKHGTTNWALIRRHFKSNRTRDSVIKRWHGKLKYEKNNQTLPQPENQKTNNNKAPPAIRKNRGEPSQHGNRKGTRSDSQNLQIDQEKAAKMIIQKPNDSRRFQRLRSFLENTNNTRQKSKTIRALKKQEMIEDENKQDEKGEDSNFEYQHEWTKLEDEKLRSAVLNESITSLKKLAELMGCSERELKKRWKHEIYKIIKLQDKVGGFLKYSIDEDTILTIAHRNGLRWEEMMVFLPGRSEFSIEARWRRLARSEFEVQLSKNKHFMMRQFLKKIVEKRKTEREPVDLNSQLELLKY